MADSCDANQTIWNLTHGTDLSVLVFSSWEWIIYQIIWPCIILFGICNNTSFIWIVINSPSLHTSTYTYLVNLAISDLLFLITNYTPRIVYYHESSLKRRIPVIVNAFIYLLAYCSLGTVTLVSLERFLAICYPIKHHLIKGTRRTNKLILSIWCISLCLAIPYPCLLFMSGSRNICVIWPDNSAYDDYPNQYISSDLTWITDLINCMNFVLIFFMMILNNVLYFKIYVAVRGRNNKNLGLNSSSDLQHRQVANMLIVNGIFFFMCWAFQIFTTPVVLIYRYLIKEFEYTQFFFIWGLLSEILFWFKCMYEPGTLSNYQ